MSLRLGIGITADVLDARRGFRAVAGDVVRLGRAVTDRRAGFGTFGRQVERTGRTMRGTGRDARAMGKAINRAEREDARPAGRRLAGTFRRQVERTGRTMRDTGRDARAMGKAIDHAARHRRTSGAGMLAGGRRAVGIAGAVAGGAYGTGRAVGSAVDTDRARTRLKTSIGATEAAAGAEHARAMVQAGRTLHQETELLASQYSFASAGLSADLSRTGSTVASQVATATQGEIRAVSAGLATVWNNLGDTIEAATPEKGLRAVGDLLTHVQTIYQVEDFSGLGDALARATPRASAHGIDLHTTATALGMLASAGITGPEGGTAFGAFARQLVPAQDKIAGFQAYRTEGGDLEFGRTIASLHAALDGLNVDARATLLSDAFGDEGMPAVSAFLARAETAHAEVEATRASTGAAARGWQTYRDSAGGAVDSLSARVGVLGAVLGSTLDIQGWADWAGAGAGALSEALEGSERLRTVLRGATAVGATAAGAGALYGAGRWIGRRLRGAGRGEGAAGRPAMGSSIRTMRVAAGVVHVTRATGAGRTTKGAAGRTTKGAAGRTTKGVGRTVLGRTTALLGRLEPVARGVMTVVGAVVGLVSLKFIALGAIIAGAVYLVYKYWEPIKGFFGRIVGGIAARFRAGVDLLGSVLGSWRDVFTDFSWAGVGDALMRTLGAGITAAGGLPLAAVRTVLGKVRDLLPFSDAREGPLRDITRSGASLLPTMGRGVSRAGPGGLRGPLARELAAAAVGLALTAAVTAAEAPAIPTPVVPAAEAPAIPTPVVPAAEAPAIPTPVVPAAEAPAIPTPVVPAAEAPAIPTPVVPAAEAAPDARLGQLRELLEELVADAAPALQGTAGGAASAPAGARTVTVNYNITIHQPPGTDTSDASALAERVAREFDRRRRRGALDDLDA